MHSFVHSKMRCFVLTKFTGLAKCLNEKRRCVAFVYVSLFLTA